MNPKLLLIGLLLLASGCGTQPRLLTASSEVEQNRLDQLLGWGLKARIAVSHANEGWNASLFWEQDHERYAMRIVAPLGQKTLLISGDKQGAQLQISGQASQWAEDLELVLEQEIGVRLPLNHLRFWVKGRYNPVQEAKLQQYDEHNRLQFFSQDGWNVSIGRYTAVADVVLPQKIFIEKDTTSVRMVISEWQLK